MPSSLEQQASEDALGGDGEQQVTMEPISVQALRRRYERTTTPCWGCLHDPLAEVDPQVHPGRFKLRAFIRENRNKMGARAFAQQVAAIHHELIKQPQDALSGGAEPCVAWPAEMVLVHFARHASDRLGELQTLYHDVKTLASATSESAMSMDSNGALVPNVEVIDVYLKLTGRQVQLLNAIKGEVANAGGQN